MGKQEREAVRKFLTERFSNKDLALRMMWNKECVLEEIKRQKRNAEETEMKIKLLEQNIGLLALCDMFEFEVFDLSDYMKPGTFVGSKEEFKKKAKEFGVSKEDIKRELGWKEEQ